MRHCGAIHHCRIPARLNRPVTQFNASTTQHNPVIGELNSTDKVVTVDVGLSHINRNNCSISYSSPEFNLQIRCVNRSGEKCRRERSRMSPRELMKCSYYWSLANGIGYPLKQYIFRIGLNIILKRTDWKCSAHVE